MLTFNRLTSVFYAVIDHEFRHNIVKVAVDRLVEPQTMLCRIHCQ